MAAPMMTLMIGIGKFIGDSVQAKCAWHKRLYKEPDFRSSIR